MPSNSPARRLGCASLQLVGAMAAILWLLHLPQLTPRAPPTPPAAAHAYELLVVLPEPPVFVQDLGVPSPRHAYLPPVAFMGQALPPCDVEAGQVQLNGGCWWHTGTVPPCPRKLFAHGDGCYLPVTAEPITPVNLTDPHETRPPVSRLMPPGPVEGQRRPPCMQGEEPINGGCWMELRVSPPCPPNAAEHQGRCFAAAAERQLLPQSVDGGGGR